MPVDRVLAAWDDGGRWASPRRTRSSSRSRAATAPAAGVTWVGVLPSHRRRGILTELMRRQLDDVHERGEPLAILWASEAPIYGRFGYGIAAPETFMDAERGAFALRDDPGRAARSARHRRRGGELFPPIYESVRRERPGCSVARTTGGRDQPLADPEHWRDGAGPKFYALLEIDGEPAGLRAVPDQVEVGGADAARRAPRRRGVRRHARRRLPSSGASSSASTSSRA